VRADKTDVHSDIVGGQGVMINNGVRKTATPFTDVRLRQAVLAALDVKALDQRITGGTSNATSALFPEQSIYYSGAPGPAYDSAKAKQLVSQVKAEGSWNGTVRILCPTTQSDQGLAVKTALEAVGFTVQHEVAPTTGDLIAKVITDANYDLACWSIQLFEAAPFVKLDRFFRSTSSANRNGYSNPDMDKALDDLRLAKDVAATKVAAAKIQTILNETGSHAVLRAGETSIAYSKKIHGLTYNAETMVYFDKAYKTT
jgi:peptide/nickel transport system substrate-binding protein